MFSFVLSIASVLIYDETSPSNIYEVFLTPVDTPKCFTEFCNKIILGAEFLCLQKQITFVSVCPFTVHNFRI